MTHQNTGPRPTRMRDYHRRNDLMTDTCTRCGQTVGYDCGCTEIERLTAERDCYKARAEEAEKIKLRRTVFRALAEGDSQ